MRCARFRLPAVLLLAAAAVPGCTGGASPADGGAADLSAAVDLSPVDLAPARDYEQPGPYPVGTAHATIPSAGGSRMLPVEIWYPADESARAAAEAGMPIEDFETDPTRHAEMAAWAAAAPDGCTRRQTRSAPGATPSEAAAPYPLVVFSHCTGCVRYDMYTVAERLASLGVAVAAPDHVDDTIFSATARLDDAFLAVRAADLSSVLDALLDPRSTDVPDALRGHFDPARVGVMGHSFGAVTAGQVLVKDPRVLSAFIVAAPIDSPVLGFGTVAKVEKPTVFLLADEDNSITAYGDTLIRQNFMDTATPTWLVEVADAGHWSFSDIAGLDGQFLPGCGDGTRQTDGTPFTYLDNDTARGIASAYAAAWAGRFLLGDTGAGSFLAGDHPPKTVAAMAR